MDAETRLMIHEDAEVRLQYAMDGAALSVRNANGRVRVPISRDQATILETSAPGAEAAQEIERRLLVSALPDRLESYPSDRLRQGYLVIDESASLRLRQRGNTFKMTIKRGQGLARSEVELKVSESQAQLLWPLVGSWFIEKTRYRIPDRDAELELDLYHGRHEGLVVVEREFSDVSQARSWTPPVWAARDITEDPNYTNARLATSDLPRDAPRLSSASH